MILFTLKMLTLMHFIALSVVVFVLSDDSQPHCHYITKGSENPKRNTTCSKQLPSQNLTDDDCFIQYAAKDTKGCRDLIFQINGESDLGEVMLVPYVDMVEQIAVRSALNLTFVNVKWSNLRVQWKERGGDGKAFCREFVLSPNVDLSSNVSLFYDCPWLNYSDELHEFDFKYEAQNKETGQIEGKYYIFQLPSNWFIDPIRTSPKNWTVFSYLDISALPILTVRWQQPPSSIAARFYNVSIISNATSDVLDTKIVPADRNRSQQAVNFNGQELTGSVYIAIKIIFDNGVEGSISRSPVLFLGDHPVVLVLYKHVRNSHVKALAAFANCLKEVTQAKVLLDELDIPKSDTKDPFLWYQDAFERAEYILVMASPSVPVVCEEGIYPNVETVGMRLLAGKFSDKNCYKKFFTVVFPYCKVSDIPREAVNFKRFMLMKDFSKLIWYITHNTHRNLLFRPFYSVFSVCGSTINMKGHCKQLLESFRVAKDDLNTCNSGNLETCRKSAPDNDVLKHLETIVPINNCDDDFYHSCVKPEMNDDDDVVGSNIFPGNISELNLLGSEGEEIESAVQSKPIHHSDLDIYNLLL
ncbi:uncharacterized protein [Anabrus simplex]|uniref:uncharacterized protein isoform X2 n=1 Tax=Anabrus simplex TaxID=316456 RepID=UPI0035A2E6ED